MNTKRNLPILRVLPVLAALFLAGLACTLGSTPEVIPTPVPATPVPNVPTATAAPNVDPTAAPVQPPPQGAGLTGPQRQHLVAATVLIYMTDIDNGEYYPFGIGSGTLLSADGLILTNAHVAKPSAGGFGEDPDVLIIALNEKEDSPPVPTYIAEVRAVDGFLDLAVIQITSNLDGSNISGSLNLPYVDLGNSDEVFLGDTINIFGFPGIGGETITFTKGSVAGFSSEEPVGDRAWIKTDATIAGGNSGGLGANDFGQIIGVPTRGGAGGSNDIADCRVVQDTNGDGQMDQNDTCIPIGGFINALRPINLAVPLIRAAQTGTAYESPYGGGGGGQVSGTGTEAFAFQYWSKYFDENSGCGQDPAASFPAGIDQLTATFSYSGMTDGQDFALYWLQDGSVVVEDYFPWDYGPSDDCFPFFLHNGGDPLPNGQFTLLLFAGDGLPQIAEVSTTIGGGGGGTVPPTGGSVVVDGYVWDADTGNPISGAVVVILNPGVDVDAWLDSGTDAEIYTWASTDGSGYFVLPDALQRGVEYPAVAGAASLGYLTTTGYFLLEESDPNAITVDIELTK